MSMKFDHIGIIVKNLETGRKSLSKIFGIHDWTEEFNDPVNGVYVQFGRDASAVCYELVAPIGPESPIAVTLKNRHNILNHVAYLVPDLQAAGEHLRQQGCAPIDSAKPAIAYGGRFIQFFVTPPRFVVELIEAPDHLHSYRNVLD
jgi:methylmalonyl-CoA/ethylmalonyl-CoA epimerase